MYKTNPLSPVWFVSSERKTGKNSSKLGQVKGKTYKIKICPECGSSKVSVVLTGEEGQKVDEWECKSCKWHGRTVDEKTLTADEFLEHIEKEEGK